MSNGPTMYPSRFIPATGNEAGDKAEQAVYNALKEMPDASDWIVIHSYRHVQFVPQHADKKITDPWENYEADFIVITPDRGFIVLEVKNWSDFIPAREHPSTNDWQLNTKQEGCVRKKSPAAQADDAKRYIYDLLLRRTVVEEKCAPGDRYIKMVEHRSAVVMYAQTREQLRELLHEDDETYICRDELESENLKKRILSYFKNTNPKYRYQYNPRAILGALVPALEFQMSFSEWSDYMEKAAAPINELLPMLEGSTADILVEGCAGSGKTIMASREARRLAECYPGKRVLFLCYNGFMASYLLHLSGMKDADGSPRNLDVMTLDKLCQNLSGQHKFFCSNDLNFKKTKELAGKITKRYDYVFVDEGQDFKQEWWLLPKALCSENGRFYVFMDGNQNLYMKARGVEPGSLSLPIHIKLSKNLRNTDKIANYSACMLPEGGHIVPLGVTLCAEVQVEKHLSSSVARARKVQTLIEKLEKAGVNRADIVVLSPWQQTNPESSLQYLTTEIDCRRSKDGNLESPREHFERWIESQRHSNANVFGETIKGFKGLEARYVILTDISEPGSKAGEEPFSANDFYVGCTRAQFQLIIVPSDDYAASIMTKCKEREHCGA